MRVLHVVKTSDGAWWAARQVTELVRLGVEVQVVLPDRNGRAIPTWHASGAVLHFTDVEVPTRAPWRFPAVLRRLRKLVCETDPDIIHSHFLADTVALRLALGQGHRSKRVYQVAGPLHLEHEPWRHFDLTTAGPVDSWIASSRCIREHYLRAGVDPARVFLSYHGGSNSDISTARLGWLRTRLGIRPDQVVVGNINFIYPPKYFLGQRVGVKCHEDVIDALGLLASRVPALVGVIGGHAYRNADWYEQRLRERARRVAGDRIVFAGPLTQEEVRMSWADFDCAVHVPLSENCGGVLEPLMAGIPTVAARTGGIPELVIDGMTGKLVGKRNPVELADAVQAVLNDRSRYRAMAWTGRELVSAMFDVHRTAAEVLSTYRHLLEGEPAPAPFDSNQFLRTRGQLAAQDICA
jgi:glycosyltransferase involved in cell wall biosynthesis